MKIRTILAEYQGFNWYLDGVKITLPLRNVLEGWYFLNILDGRVLRYKKAEVESLPGLKADDSQTN